MSMIHCSAKPVALVGASGYAPNLHGVRIVAAVSRSPVVRFHRRESFQAMLERQLSRQQGRAGEGTPDVEIGEASLAAVPQGAEDDDIGRSDDRAFLLLDISDAGLVQDAPQDGHPGVAVERPDELGTHCSLSV